MGIPFSNSADRTGLVELLEDMTNTQSASSSSYPLKTKTRDINNAYAKFMLLAIQAEGRWQVDDTNQTDYPMITFDIISGQQDYTFTVDGSSTPNQIWHIQRIEIKDSNGVWITLDTYDQTDETSSMTQRAILSGTPQRYDKLANGIWLDLKPNYNSTGGIKIWFARSPVYFVSTDTIKQPGVPDMFHEYFAIRPAYFYSLAKGLSRAKEYKLEMLEFEQMIEQYYGQREKDEIPIMTMEGILYK